MVVDQPVLRFTTEHSPKDPSAGFVFGSDPDACDVLLHPSSDSGISRRQFTVFFRPDSGLTLLRNLSRQGTSIQMPGEPRLRLKSQRVLNAHTVVDILCSSYTLKLTSIREAGCDSDYQNYFAGLSAIAPNLDHMRLASSTGQSSTTFTEDTYTLDRELGRGGFGVVYRAAHRHTGELVAVKIYTGRADRANSPWMETALLRQLHHDHIIRFYEFIARQASSRLVMEYATGGSMAEQHRERKFSQSEAKTVITQVLRGLSYLHGKGIVHRDIKPGNILLLSRDPIHAKIGDFGCSRNGQDEHNTLCGTVTHAAPEVFSPPYTSKVDIWSIGVIVAELWTTLPRFTAPEEWRASLIATASTTHGNLRHFLFRTLNKNPDIRPTADQCLNLEFLAGTGTQPKLQQLMSSQHEMPVYGDQQTNQNTTRLDAQLPDTIVPLTDRLEKDPRRQSRPSHCTTQSDDGTNLVASGEGNNISREFGAGDTIQFLFDQVDQLATCVVPCDPQKGSSRGSGTSASGAVIDATVQVRSNEPHGTVRCSSNLPQGYAYFPHLFEGALVVVKSNDKVMNITQLARAMGFSRVTVKRWREQSHLKCIIVRGNRKIQGSYASYKDVLQLCTRHHISLSVEIRSALQST